MGIGPDFDFQDVADAAEIELARRLEAEPLRYARLNGAARRYAEAWCDPTRTIVLFAAPNGIGKTLATVICLGWTVWPGQAPDWFRNQISLKLLKCHRSFRIASTAEEAGEAGTIQRALKDLWPRGRYQAVKNRKAFSSLYECDGGWVGDVMTYDQDPLAFEGATRGVIVYNEPPPKAVRKACVFRTRMGGFEVFPMTPLSSAAWIHDDLVERAPGDPSIALVTGKLEEACKDHSLNGHMTHETIERLKKEVDPDEYMARIEGEFMHLSGRIWKAFKQELFVSKEPLKVQPIGPKFQVIDPAGFNKPYAVAWGQVAASPLHGLQFLREWPDGSAGEGQYFERVRDVQMTVERYVEVFKEVEGDLGFRKDEVFRIMDRRYGHARDSKDGRSLREIFSDHGYHFNDSYSVPEKQPELKWGIEAVRNYLRVDPLTNIPFLMLDPRCVNLRRAMARWALDPKTQKPMDDVWKNFADLVRYTCAAGLEYHLAEPDSVWNPEGYGAPRWGVNG